MTQPLPALRPGEFADTEEPDLFDTVDEDAMPPPTPAPKPTSPPAGW